MTEQPDPGDGWRIATGDDWKDRRCQYWCAWDNAWKKRPRFLIGEPFGESQPYRIPDDANPPVDIEQQVCDDIKSRQRLGVAKYGTTVADNPLSLRQWLQHAYEECLDQSVYLRRAISEIDIKEANQ